ncbi:glycosyltransferase family 8 protein [bacterium]|nr:glycosyltransferase family 8 protein [bacterium]
MKDNISICFCINDLYAQHLCVVLTSILENNPYSNFSFYVITNDITEYNKNKIFSLKNKYNNFEIQYISVDKSIFSNFNITIDYISIETYFRYILANLLPNLDKILYLDVDLVVNGELSSLWNTDIDNYYCAGVEDINFDTNSYKKEISLNDNDIYINAGVILFNLKKIRENKISDKFFENQELYNNIKYQDQDIINITLRNNIKKLDYIYNFTTKTSRKFPKLKEKAIIIHYVGPKKPWKDLSLNKLKILYYYYRSQGPYNNYSMLITKLLKLFK